MTERNFDAYLKALLSRDDIEVPRKVSRGIDSTLSSISRKKGGFSLKRRAKVAALLCALTLGMVSAFPVVAENIPVINKILGNSSIFGQSFPSHETELHFSNLNEVRNHAIAVEQQVQNIIVRELAYDGAAFYAVWDVTDTSTDPMDSIHLYSSSVSINHGREISAGVFIPETLDAHTVRVVQVYPIPGIVEMPEQVMVSIRFSKDGAALPEVTVGLNKSQLLASVRTVELNTRVKLGSTTAQLRSMTQSPAYVSLTMELGRYEPDKYEFVLLDDRGNELQQVDMGSVERKGLYTTITRFYKAPVSGNSIDRILVLAANASNSKTLNTHSPASLRSRTQVELNAQLPVTVPTGDGREITVTSIELDNQTLRVVLSAKDMSINTFIRMGGISLWDGTRNQDSAYTLSLARSLGESTYSINYNLGNLDYNNAVLCFGDYDEAITVVHEIRAE
jgi:hypothetical protein